MKEQSPKLACSDGVYRTASEIIQWAWTGFMSGQIMSGEMWITTSTPPPLDLPVLVCWRERNGLRSDETLVAKYEPDRNGSSWNAMGPGIDTPSDWMFLPELPPLRDSEADLEDTE